LHLHIKEISPVSGQLFRVSKMGGLFSYFRGLLGSREMRILILGLDGAGEGTMYTVLSVPKPLTNLLPYLYLTAGLRISDPTFSLKCGSGFSFTLFNVDPDPAVLFSADPDPILLTKVIP
jgi:hypothetical protein